MAMNVLLTPTLYVLSELPLTKRALRNVLSCLGLTPTNEEFIETAVQQSQAQLTSVLVSLTIGAAFAVWSPVLLLLASALSPFVLFARGLVDVIQAQAAKELRSTRQSRNADEYDLTPRSDAECTDSLEKHARTEDYEYFCRNLVAHIKAPVPHNLILFLLTNSLVLAILFALSDLGFGLGSWCCFGLSVLGHQLFKYVLICCPDLAKYLKRSDPSAEAPVVPTRLKPARSMDVTSKDDTFDHVVQIDMGFRSKVPSVDLTRATQGSYKTDEWESNPIRNKWSSDDLDESVCGSMGSIEDAEVGDTGGPSIELMGVELQTKKKRGEGKKVGGQMHKGESLTKEQRRALKLKGGSKPLASIVSKREGHMTEEQHLALKAKLNRSRKEEAAATKHAKEQRAKNAKEERAKKAKQEESRRMEQELVGNMVEQMIAKEQEHVADSASEASERESEVPREGNGVSGALGLRTLRGVKARRSGKKSTQSSRAPGVKQANETTSSDILRV